MLRNKLNILVQLGCYTMPALERERDSIDAVQYAKHVVSIRLLFDAGL